ncbi:MAG: FixH family protein [Rhodobacteraceae bacterium]|nr:FixH family protein [Paracoccaceae bacterium]MBR9822710.1 FixH family protein [Paracoccaceae bacterium]
MMSETAESGFRLTGWHVLAGFVAFFGVIITVNVYMASQAIGTFPGLEVDNTYVFSQQFDERVADQQRLGWQVAAEDRDGWIHLTVTDAAGTPVRPQEIHAVVGRPTDSTDDRVPQLAWTGQGFEAPLELSEGKWIVRFSAIADDGTEFLQRLDLHVTR